MVGLDGLEIEYAKDNFENKESSFPDDISDTFGEEITDNEIEELLAGEAVHK